MTAWHVTPGDIDERPNDYTAHFSCTNGETGKTVQVTITQQRGGPASDLVEGLRVVSDLLRKVDLGEELASTPLN